MNLVPSIDLIDGRCVRLQQGNFKQLSFYDICPVTLAKSYKEAGVKNLHIVDLTGAQQQSLSQLKIIAQMIDSFGAGVQVGGGIRSENNIRDLINCGAETLVVGSLALQSQDFMRTLITNYGANRFVLALDCRVRNQQAYISSNGWTRTEDLSLWNALKLYPQIKNILCTDISCDGMQTGPNVALYKDILALYPQLQLQASGGVGSLEDLIKLQQAALPACIVGKALFEKNFSIEEALSCLNAA